jgi:serine phosphatase RsbU (regulator of sigma subunit)/Tfp pilus assembly protein PilF
MRFVYFLVVLLTIIESAGASASSNPLDSLNRLAEEYLDKDPAKTLELGTQAMAMAEAQRNTPGKAAALINLGKLYETLGENEKAVANYFQSLKLFEQLHDSSGIVRVYNALGVLFRNQDNFDKALEYLTDAEKIGRNINNPRVQAESYNNLGSIHYFRRDYDQALSYFKQSLKIRQNAGLQTEAAKSMNNIGLVYKHKHEYDKALQYFMQSLQTQRDLGNKAGISTVLDNIGDIYYEKGDNQKALAYHLEGLQAASEGKALHRMKESYESLIDTYSRMGDYKRAFELKTRHAAIRDSLYNEHSTRIVAETQTRYATEKKEKQIALLRQEATIRDLQLHRNRLVSYCFLVGGLLVSGLLGVIYRGARLKQKANHLLATQNEEIQKKNLKITDSIRYAKRIQEALSPETEQLRQRFGDMFVLFNPRDIVSGDFFWHYSEDHLTVLAVVDCTGHGVPGAFMTVLGNTILGQIVAEQKEFDPSRILQRIDEKLALSLGSSGTDKQRPNDGMDVALCVLDHQKQVLYFAGAKRPLYLFQNGQYQELKGDIFPMGGGAHYKQAKSFHTHEIPVQSGDVFYLFSDGFPDQFGGEAEPATKYMTKRFRAFLTELHTLPANVQQARLETELTNWKGNQPQTDDILVVGVRIE